MNYKIQKIFNALEADTEKVLSSLASLQDKQLNYTLSDNTWSVNQILIHILTSERIALSYMKKKSLGIANLKNSSWKEAIKLLLLKISQRIPLKYKVPQIIVRSTPDVMPLQQLIEQWKKERSDLNTFIQSIEEREYSKENF